MLTRACAAMKQLNDTAPPRRITIFEGPDGSGKSYAAKRYAAETGALHIHHGAYPSLSGPDRFGVYFASMLPAFRGLCDVVLDRCWYSERPYGLSGRDNIIRLSMEARADLDTVASWCRVVLVLCLPQLSVCAENYTSRRGEEYLDNLEQLRRVHEEYQRQPYRLPMVEYDFTKQPELDLTILEATRGPGVEKVPW